MLVNIAFSLAEAHPIDDGRVVELIGNNGILRAKKGFKYSRISIKCCSIQDRIFHPEKFGYSLFQLFMNGLGAADEPNGRHAVAVRVNRVFGRLNYTRVRREPQIVVGTEINDFLSCSGVDNGSLRSGN